MKNLFAFNRISSGAGPIAATAQFLELLKVKVSRTTLTEALLSHPDYPSLLSIIDSLGRWGLQTMGLKVAADKLDQLPVPFVVYFKIGGGRFLTVKEVTDGRVITLNNKGEERPYTKEDFLKRWDGVTLLAEAGENSGEVTYREMLRKERWAAWRLPLTFGFLVLLGVGRFALAMSAHVANLGYFSALLGGHLLGILITGLLLWYEYDEHNPLLQAVCSAGKKTNCQAVLGSKAATVVGNITWSDIGFLYFTGGYLYLLLTGSTFLYPLFALNLLALPYILFSVYYQARIAHQWCLFCLSVQAILLLEALSALLISQTPISLFPYFPTQSFIILLLSFLFPAFAWLFAKPFIYTAKKGTEYHYQLARFKNNGEVFGAMLHHQPAMTSDPGDLGIRIGNPQAPNVLTKVCNPYCGPCAKAHPKIEELIKENPDWQARIIFTATGEDEDHRTPPATHLLAIAEQKDEEKTRQALDDWYNAEEKDYERFAAKYPMNGELDIQKETLKTMDNWCKEVGITHTPTFFVNGYRLPDAYHDIAELKHIASLA